MEFVNIALAADDNYAQHAAVVMASTKANVNTDDVPLRFFLLSDGITESKMDCLKKTSAMLDVQLVILDLSEKEQFASFYTSGHISKAAYFRLMLAEILPTDVHKIIYLDVDLLVLDDIEKLWKTELNGHPVGAIPDFGIMSSARLMKQKHDVLGLSLDREYFNSGVMVMDIDAWRANDYGKQVIDLAQSGSFPHHDQDALNKVFMDKWQPITECWNVIPPVYNLFLKVVLNSKLRNRAVAAKKNVAVLHYAGRYKPWEFECTEGFNDKYYYYLSKTAFADVNMPQPRNMKGKSLLRQQFRLKLAEAWCCIIG